MMTPCPTCAAMRFATCHTHGDFCARCDGLSCPKCQAGNVSLALLLITLALLFAAGVAVALTDFRPRLRAPVEPSSSPNGHVVDARCSAQCRASIPQLAGGL